MDQSHLFDVIYDTGRLPGDCWDANGIADHYSWVSVDCVDTIYCYYSNRHNLGRFNLGSYLRVHIE